MDKEVKVPRGTIFEFFGFHSTISRTGICYLGFEMKNSEFGDVVIVTKEDNSNFTTRLLSGYYSENLVVQVKSPDAYISSGKLFGKLSVCSRLAAHNKLVKIESCRAREVLIKLMNNTRVQEGYHLFEIKNGKVYVNKSGKGKSLEEVTLKWIKSKFKS